MSRNASFFWGLALALVSFLLVSGRANASYNLPDPYTWSPDSLVQITNDTTPLQDRYGNWVEEPSNNPFDLLDPEDLVKTVEYDPVTNTYILTEKIGDENYRAPTSMTFEEYMEWNKKEEEKDYFKKL